MQIRSALDNNSIQLDQAFTNSFLLEKIEQNAMPFGGCDTLVREIYVYLVGKKIDEAQYLVRPFANGNTYALSLEKN